jgi:GGDEF domain-containing protein
MADDYRAEPALGTPRMTDRPSQRDFSQRRGYSAYSHAAPQATLKHTIHDVASVLGAPADALPPRVMEAALRLLGEIDRLHWQAERDAHHIAFLEQLADADPVLPCLNRRAFLRDFEAFLEDGGGGAVPLGVAAVIHVGGIERLAMIHGLAAAEAALEHACAVLKRGLRASDLIASLGGGIFALLLTVADHAGAELRLAAIRADLNAPPFSWMGETVDLTLGAGLYDLAVGDRAESALAAADAARPGIG